MRAFHFAAAVLGIAALPVAASADSPLTFNVAVQVSNMLPDVVAMAVKCTVNASTNLNRVASGEGQAQLAGGAFNGVVPVAMTTTLTAQQLLSQQLSWECDLFAVDGSGSEVLVARPGGGNPPWASAASGSNPVNAIGGDFPPGTVYPFNATTHRPIKPASDTTATP